MCQKRKVSVVYTWKKGNLGGSSKNPVITEISGKLLKTDDPVSIHISGGDGGVHTCTCVNV